MVRNLLHYEQYAWYVEMYIGLYLLIPFLNLLWEAAGERGLRGALVLTLLLTTTLPSLVNHSSYPILPDWWTTIYPVTYYFLGAYLADTREKRRGRWWHYALLLAAALLAFGLYNYWRGKQYGAFLWGSWNDWGGYQNVTDGVLLFLLLESMTFWDRTPHWTKALLGKLSQLSFGAYLASYAFDRTVYVCLFPDTPFPQRLCWLVPLVAANFLCSTAVSLAADVVCRGLLAAAGGVGGLINRRKT